MSALPIDLDAGGVDEILIHDRDCLWVPSARQLPGGGACLSRKALALARIAHTARRTGHIHHSWLASRTTPTFGRHRAVSSLSCTLPPPRPLAWARLGARAVRSAGCLPLSTGGSAAPGGHRLPEAARAGAEPAPRRWSASAHNADANRPPLEGGGLRYSGICWFPTTRSYRTTIWASGDWAAWGYEGAYREIWEEMARRAVVGLVGAMVVVRLAGRNMRCPIPKAH